MSYHKKGDGLQLTWIVYAGEGDTDALRRALLIGFANHLARRMAQHNGYKTLNEHSALAQLHPSTAPLHADDYGLTSEYVIYTSLVATARIFLSKVRPSLLAHKGKGQGYAVPCSALPCATLASLCERDRPVKVPLIAV